VSYEGGHCSTFFYFKIFVVNSNILSTFAYRFTLTLSKMDYRISVEEFENQAEIAEMARSLVNEAFEEIQDSKPSPLTEEVNVPLLDYFIQL
jgi:hypothetical protein